MKCSIVLINQQSYLIISPYLARMAKQLLKVHGSKYLPDHLTSLMLSLINIREIVDMKAERGL